VRACVCMRVPCYHICRIISLSLAVMFIVETLVRPVLSAPVDGWATIRCERAVHNVITTFSSHTGSWTVCRVTCYSYTGDQFVYLRIALRHR